MSCPFLPDFLEPRLLVPCFFGVASLSVDAADDDDVAGDADEDGASDDASESCTGAARADRAREGCTREGRAAAVCEGRAAAAREGRARARGARRATKSRRAGRWTPAARLPAGRAGRR